MQKLIQAWNNVDKKDKCEFRLRVAKRKDALSSSAPNVSSSQAVPTTGD